MKRERTVVVDELLERSPHFTLQPLAEGVTAAIARDGGAAIANAGIIDLGGLVVVFDTTLTPQAGADLRRAARELTGRDPQLVVNSHYHNDHIWGNQAFTPTAHILASAGTRQALAVDGAEELRSARANAARRLQETRQELAAAASEAQKDAARMWLGYYQGLVEALPGLSVRPPDLTFTERMELHGEQRSAVLFSFEGAHTASDTVLLLPAEGILFASDLLFTGCHPYLGDGDAQKARQALHELARSGAQRFVPGHGPVGSLADLELMDSYIAYCQEQAIILAQAAPLSLEGAGSVPLPAAFTGWKLGRFFQANLRFMAERLSS